MPYRCATCNEEHEGLPDLGVDRPDQWWDVPEERRVEDAELGSDTCTLVLDGQRHCFVRGVVELPVHGQDERFGIGGWVSLHPDNFARYVDDPDTTALGPCFGWFCNRLSCYAEDTRLLKTMVHFRGGGLRPAIELEPTEHPLAVDQREGIALDRAWAIVHHYEGRDPA